MSICSFCWMLDWGIRPLPLCEMIFYVFDILEWPLNTLFSRVVSILNTWDITFVSHTFHLQKDSHKWKKEVKSKDYIKLLTHNYTNQ